MRSDDAPREENETKGQDMVIHSRLVDERTSRVWRSQLTRWEGPVPPPSAIAEAFRKSHVANTAGDTPSHKQSLHRATCPLR